MCLDRKAPGPLCTGQGSIGPGSPAGTSEPDESKNERTEAGVTAQPSWGNQNHRVWTVTHFWGCFTWYRICLILENVKCCYRQLSIGEKKKKQIKMQMMTIILITDL